MSFYIHENGSFSDKKSTDIAIRKGTYKGDQSKLSNISDEEARSILNPPLTDEQLAEQAQSEMITELNWCDLQLKYHATGDTKRAISTVELINAYAVDCRDYVQNVDGVLTIVGDKPERPE